MALASGVQAQAHHPFAAEYDLKHPITVHGVIAQVRLGNPHSWFVVDVKDPKVLTKPWIVPKQTLQLAPFDRIMEPAPIVYDFGAPS